MNETFKNCINKLTKLNNVKNSVEVAPILSQYFPEILQNNTLLKPEQMVLENDQVYTKHTLYQHKQDNPWLVQAIVWKPKAKTPIHNHCCWCTFGIYKGTLTEEIFDKNNTSQKVIVKDSQKQSKGFIGSMVPDGNDIHRIINPTNDIAISIHFYGINSQIQSNSILKTFQCC